jgi:hypothetical protein
VTPTNNQALNQAASFPLPAVPKKTPGQAITCGNIIVVHGTRTTSTTKPTVRPLRPCTKPGTVCRPKRNAAASLSEGIKSLCFRHKPRRDINAQQVEGPNPGWSVTCFPTPADDDTPLSARQITACDTRFPQPTPAAVAARAAFSAGGPDPAEWDLALPDGVYLEDVSSDFAESEEFASVIEGIKSFCFRKVRRDEDEDDEEEEAVGTDAGILVICFPEEADSPHGELVGRLMV